MKRLEELRKEIRYIEEADPEVVGFKYQKIKQREEEIEIIKNTINYVKDWLENQGDKEYQDMLDDFGEEFK